MEIEGIRIKRFNLEKEISTAPQLTGQRIFRVGKLSFKRIA